MNKENRENKLFEKINKSKNGHYCHAFEGTADQFIATIDSIVDEFFGEFSIKTIIDFLQTLEIYYYDPANSDDENMIAEDELYNFNIKNYIKENYFL